ncbi:MAG: sulfatase-like hydrolase/transferase [Planctomycetaceae bacterium]
MTQPCLFALRRVRSLLFVFALIPLIPWPVADVAAAERPNFILCMTDDQGWGDVGYMQHPELKTPVLDEMAATGLRCDRFYAAHPVCSPTRGSFLTGRHPNRFACFSWGHTLRPEEVTLAEALKQAGYATGHFGKWHLGSCRAEDPVSPGESGFDTWVSSPNFYENDPLFSENGVVKRAQGESSQVTVRAALKFIRQQQAKQQPFLAVIWFGNPHGPHIGTADLKAPYADLSAAKQNYYAEIAGIDRAMGDLRKELDQIGARENTVLLFTSDNGPQGKSAGSNGGLRGNKGTLYEGGVRVPGLIEWPRVIKSPRTSTATLSTSDIYPTMLELAGAKVDQQPRLDGISFAPLLRGETPSARSLGFWVHPTGGISTPADKLLAAQLEEQAGNAPSTAPPERTAASRMEKKYPVDTFPGHATWLSPPWKLHRISSGKKQTTETYALYNLDEDPQEQSDLSKQHPDRLNAMLKELTTWQTSVVNSLNGADYIESK